VRTFEKIGVMIRCIEGGKYDGILGNISTANHESFSDVPEHTREYRVIPSHLNKEMFRSLYKDLEISKPHR